MLAKYISAEVFLRWIFWVLMELIQDERSCIFNSNYLQWNFFTSFLKFEIRVNFELRSVQNVVLILWMLRLVPWQHCLQCKTFSTTGTLTIRSVYFFVSRSIEDFPACFTLVFFATVFLMISKILFALEHASTRARNSCENFRLLLLLISLKCKYKWKN